MDAKYRIALIEPSPLLAAGFKALLADGGAFSVAYVFTTLQGYQLRAPHIQPDVLVLSPSLFDCVSRTSIRQALALPAGLPLVGLVAACFEEKVLKQFDAVVDLFCSPQALAAKLQAALRSEADGAEQPDSYNLSDRELDILVAVAKGLTNKEIADLHDISVNTVITHRKNITRKTGIKSVSGLTVYALLNNLIDQNDVE